MNAIELELFRHLMVSIAEEMSVVLSLYRRANSSSAGVHVITCFARRIRLITRDPGGFGPAVEQMPRCRQAPGHHHAHPIQVAGARQILFEKHTRITKRRTRFTLRFFEKRGEL